jgi:hypothetical protein
VLDGKHPDGLPGLIYFVENAVDVSPLTEEQTANLTFCCLGFARKGAAVGQIFERVQAVDEFLEPRRPANGCTFDLPSRRFG